MSLLDRAEALTKRPGTQQSKIMQLLDRLDGDLRDEVVALIWDHRHVSARAAAAVLADEFNVDITDQQVQDHRKKPRP